MKKVLLFACFAMCSCDMKDKTGNAPLIDDGTGKLIDNPNYKTDAEIAYDEKMEPYREAAAPKPDGTENIDIVTEPTAESRKEFAKLFHPRTSAGEVSVSGSENTTLIFTSAFNNWLF